MIQTKPIFTEKSFINASNGTYTFAVARQATKHEVKAMVETVFKVNVVKVTSLMRQAKTKRTGKKRLPTLSTPTKHVRVWLQKGQSISLFDIKKD